MTRMLGLALLAVAVAACGDAPPPMTCQWWGTLEQLHARPSPFDSTMARIDSTELKLCYSRPFARDREIFGGLVPYDTLWRTGANEPTILHVSGPVSIAGIDVEPGDYSLYTIPRRSGPWTVIVNASTSQWGLTRDERGADGVLYSNAYTDDVRDEEVGRAPVQVDGVGFTEQLTASFGAVGGAEVELRFDWAETRVVVPIRASGGG